MTRFALDPVHGLLRLQDELDRLFGQRQSGFGPSGGHVFPPINVFTDDSGYVVRAEVPGIKADQLSVNVESRQLVIAGERSAPAATPASYHRRERRFGGFSRTIQLPPEADTEHTEADVRHGVLTVRIPKLATAKARQIAVKTV